MMAETLDNLDISTIEAPMNQLLREAQWDHFLTQLSPWELHWLCDERHSREMHFHDQFVEGLITIQDVEQTLTEAFV